MDSAFSSDVTAIAIGAGKATIPKCRMQLRINVMEMRTNEASEFFPVYASPHMIDIQQEPIPHRIAPAIDKTGIPPRAKPGIYEPRGSKAAPTVDTTRAAPIKIFLSEIVGRRRQLTI